MAGLRPAGSPGRLAEPRMKGRLGRNNSLTPSLLVLGPLLGP